MRRQDVHERHFAALTASGVTVPCCDIIRIKSAAGGCPRLTCRRATARLMSRGTWAQSEKLIPAPRTSSGGTSGSGS